MLNITSKIGHGLITTNKVYKIEVQYEEVLSFQCT